MFKRPNSIFLFCLLLLITVVFAYFNQQGILLSDQYLYAKNAYLFAEGNFELSPSVFSNRFAVFIPTAWFIKLLGMEYWVVSIWPLLTFVLLLTGTFFYLRKQSPQIALWATVFLATNPLLIKLSADLLPDLILAVFTTLAMYCIQLAQSVKNTVSAFRWSFLFALCFIIATLAKETTAFLLPFIGALMLIDCIQKKNLRFWLGVIVSGLLLGGTYLAFYQLHTGDLLYRLKGIEQEHNISKVWSYYGSSTFEILARLTYKPLVFLLSSQYYSYLFFLAFIALLYFKKEQQERSFKVFWALYLGYLLAMFWWGSTSLKGYNPMPLQSRMWILLLPPLCIFSAYTLVHWKTYVNFRFPMIAFCLIALACIGSALWWHHDWEAIFALYFVLLLAGYAVFQQKISSGWAVFILLPLLAYQGLFVFKYHKTKTAYFYEKNLIRQLTNSTDNLVIYSDDKLAGKYDVYFDFAPPSGLKILDWNTMQKVSFDSSSKNKLFVWINRQRVKELNTRYGHQLPQVLAKAIEGKKPVLENQQVAVYEITK
ncbi:phospholipid carrier-dependent glycosyltransferase [Rapidithrix thailandica]|uniref:Phospholipid carrier-dependent glycosyltransferase n=1 Tax=Rapidithrix thailandica TaxID=413964 RepID=A0AAW9S355_9BACT